MEKRPLSTRSKYLFIHQNFPGQFKHLAPALAAQGHEVVGVGMNEPTIPQPGVRYFRHNVAAQPHGPRPPTQLKDLYGKVLRGESAAARLEWLKEQGFSPDVIFVHPGWGEALYVRDIFPKAKLLIYAEYFYQAEGGDAFFDPEFAKPSSAALQRLRLRNTHLLHAMSVADHLPARPPPGMVPRPHHGDPRRHRHRALPSRAERLRAAANGRPDAAARR
jgi:hypothetical protein